MKTGEGRGGNVIFYWVDSSSNHTLYLDCEKAKLICCIINHLRFFFFYFRIFSKFIHWDIFLGEKQSDQDPGGHSDNTKRFK